MLPKISIITPCLNSEATLERAIQSLISQNYPNLEYIIIDGCSNDGTINIVQKYGQHIHKWISEPDRGTSDAINKGIKLATGDYIGFLLSDDLYNKNSLLLVGNYLANYPDTEVVYGDILYVGPFRPPFRAKARKYLTMDRLAIPAGSVYLLSCFIHRDCFKRWGVFDLSYQISNDYELYLRLLSKGVKFSYLNNIIGTCHYGGMSSSMSPVIPMELRRAFYTYKTSLFAKFIFEIVLLKNNFFVLIKKTKNMQSFVAAYRKIRNCFVFKNQEDM